MKHLKTLLFICFALVISSCSEANTKQNNKALTQSTSKNTTVSNFIQEKITDNLFVLKAPNYNTNIGVFIGEKQLLLIDPMSGSDNQNNLLEAIKQLSDKPIKYVINTHSHEDHSEANRFFKELGATIVSHQNSKYSQAEYDVTCSDTYTIDMGNEQIELYHTISHTFDDALVYFKNNDAIFMGDTYMTNSFPHFYYGGGVKDI